MSGQVYSGTLGANRLSRLSVFVYFDNRIPLFVCIVLSIVCVDCIMKFRRYVVYTIIYILYGTL